MAALRCSRCGALIQLDGTTSCSCVLPAVDDLNATYDAFRPRRKPASSRQVEVGAPERTPEETEETGRPRMGRRGKVVVLGAIAAVTLGTAAFTLNAMSSGQEDGDRPPLSAWAPDKVPPEWTEGLDVPSPGGPHDGGPSESAEGGTSHEGGAESEDSGNHDGSPAPKPSDEGSSPPSSGDADGGPTGDPGGHTGDSSDAGGTQGSGGSDGGGGDDQLGKALGDLFGGLFGGDDHKGRGHHGDDDHNNGRDHHGGGHDHNNDKGKGKGNDRGGNHHGGGHGR